MGGSLKWKILKKTRTTFINRTSVKPYSSALVKKKTNIRIQLRFTVLIFFCNELKINEQKI